MQNHTRGLFQEIFSRSSAKARVMCLSTVFTEICRDSAISLFDRPCLRLIVNTALRCGGILSMASLMRLRVSLAITTRSCPPPTIGLKDLCALRLKTDHRFCVSQVIEKKTLDDYIQIILQRLVLIEFIPVEIKSYKGFLNNILCCSPVPDDRICKVDELGIVQVKKGLVTVMVPFLQSQYESAFIHGTGKYNTFSRPDK